MKTSVLTIEDRIGLVEDWLLNSGIQSDDGGFYAWQDIEDKSHAYLYSEITGYAITTLCFLYAITKNKAFIDRAKKAARWILRDALDPSGGVLTRKYIKNAVSHYSFGRQGYVHLEIQYKGFCPVRRQDRAQEESAESHKGFKGF